jgi:hypothetical protein
MLFGEVMSVVLQFSEDAEAKALPILLRHSPGTVLSDRTYVVQEAVMDALRAASVDFREIRPALNLPFAEGSPIGERV